MEYAEFETLAVLSDADIRQRWPDISFPLPIEPDHVGGLGLVPVHSDPLPVIGAGEQLEPGELRRDGDRVVRGWTLKPAPAPTSADVDAERDRRISAGFEFGGVWYQSRLPSDGKSGDWEAFSGKALEALMAVMAGAQPGDLRWSDPAEDFAWIAADNSRMPMDAQTVIELAKAASAHRSRHTFAGSDLKAFPVIPANYADDQWWPHESFS